jgi:hypothetical protein
LDVERKYVFAVYDYIANGGDNLSFLTDLPRVTPDLLVRDALINHVKKITGQGGVITATKEGRIRNVK